MCPAGALGPPPFTMGLYCALKDHPYYVPGTGEIHMASATLTE